MSATVTMTEDTREASGFYCSTSGTYFTDKESLNEHYKSDFHRYNLKRKVAGLPPVTKEWFDARKAQLSVSVAGPAQRIWIDPLTKKKFLSENTYQAHIKSKKYQDLVQKSGQPAPAVVVTTRKQDGTAAEQQQQQPQAAASKAQAGYHVKAPSAGYLARPRPADAEPMQGSPAGKDEEHEDGSDWETASEDSEQGAADGAEWEEWDVRRSLFDNHVSKSMQANLEYMHKNFGFYVPDAEYLKDPEGLLRYLGTKLQYGRVPLYTSGDDENAKQYRSLHAVQRHMVDTQQCRMLYDGNEDEYADFYEYPEDMEEDNAAGTLALANGDADGSSTAVAGGYELVVGGDGISGGRVLGSREFSRYYKQRARPDDERRSVAINTLVCKYRSLGIATGASSEQELAERRVARQVAQKADKAKLALFMRSNIIRDLPKNCTH